MLLTEIAPGEAAPESADPRPAGAVMVGLGTGFRALFAVASSLLLSCGLALVVWAVTPGSGDAPVPALRAGVTAFCAANGMTVKIGHSGLTLTPLMISVVAIALLVGVAGRGRTAPRGRAQELVAVTVAAVVYAAGVAAAGVVIGSPGAVRADQWWRPGLVALVVVGAATVIRGTGWREFLLDRSPPWLPVSLRLGAAGTATLVGGGAITLVIGLVRSFTDSTTVQALAAPGAAGGFGMALLGIAYVPNAVIAGAGYSAGVGFTIGDGTYSPFGSSPAEMPAAPLLTAAPDGSAFVRTTLLLLLFPVLAGVLVGHGAAGRLDNRRERLLAAAGAGLFAGLMGAVLAVVAGGGVTGGEWPTSGVPPLLFGAVITVVLAAVGAAVTAFARVPVAPATADQDDDPKTPVMGAPAVGPSGDEAVKDVAAEPGDQTEEAHNTAESSHTAEASNTEPDDRVN